MTRMLKTAAKDTDMIEISGPEIDSFKDKKLERKKGKRKIERKKKRGE